MRALPVGEINVDARRDLYTLAKIAEVVADGYDRGQLVVTEQLETPAANARRYT